MTPDLETLAETIWDAVYDQVRGSKRAVRAAVGVLAREDENSVDAAADLVLQRSVGRLWKNGWLPYDVVRVVGKERDEFADALIVDVIAAPADQVWWDRESPHLGQWARRHILTRDEALVVVITTLAVLTTLPKLPTIAPATTAHHGVDQKVLTRVRGLLAKAESTQFPEEAEALSAKAQELMNRHALERALVDSDHHVAQTANARRLWLDTPYIGAKAQLVNVVAIANRCRAVVYEQLGFVALLGDELDLEITELLSTSLLLQATRAMVHEGSKAERSDESRSRTYRQSFLLAYANRIGERLRSVTDVTDDRLLPVLVDREKAVDRLFDSMFPATVTKSYTVRSAAGWGAGRAAADRANLNVGQDG